MSVTRKPVVCVSYLADAALWTVPQYPSANAGAEVQAVEHSIAADGPMVAATLEALGVSTCLLTNDIGEDTHGRAAQTWLKRNGVAAVVNVRQHVPTPWIVIIADHKQTRTWFPYLPGVAEALERVDVTPITTASLIYVDGYQLVERAAIRAIKVARAAQVPLLVNLGGSPLTPEMTVAMRRHSQLIIQTNVADVSYRDAARVARLLHSATEATWVVITAGAAGSYALGREGELAAPAFGVTVRHTHCAGAAFSAGLLYGVLEGWPMREIMTFASASGALRCERAHHEPMPSLTELELFIGSRRRQHPESAA